MKVTVIILLIGFLSVSCQNNSAKLESATISAKTMVCDKCKERVEKAVRAVDGVRNVSVDLNAKVVTVDYVSTRTNVDTIESAICEAGYDANNRKRNEEAYEALDECCKVPR